MRPLLRGRLAVLGLLLALPSAASAAHVNVITIEGVITSASYEYLKHAIERSESEDATALLVELDTPGGVLTATQEIIQALLNTDLPVIVYVAPRGAWAASAGALITMAGHVAAMSPGSIIGAASPISASGEGGTRDDEDGARRDVALEKVEKFTTAFIESVAKERGRNVEWAARAVREAEAITADEALELGVIDFVARDRDDLFEQLKSHEIQIAGEPRRLDLVDLEVRRIEMTTFQRFITFIAQPQVAGLLMLLGLAGLYMEVQQPGMIIPGAVGLTALILAAIGFSILPFSWLGMLLMVIGIGLMVGEIFVTSYGVLLVTGAGCLLLGGSMLFDVPEVSGVEIPFWTILLPVVGSFAGFAALVLYALGRSLAREQSVGVAELVGAQGRTATNLTPDGKVFVRGEYWSASAEEEIPLGEFVEITAVEGLRLRVRRPDSNG